MEKVIKLETAMNNVDDDKNIEKTVETVVEKKVEKKTVLQKLYAAGEKIAEKEKVNAWDYIRLIAIVAVVQTIRFGKKTRRFVSKRYSKFVKTTNWEHVRYFCAGISAVLLTALITWACWSLVDVVRNIGPNVSDYNVLKLIANIFGIN